MIQLIKMEGMMKGIVTHAGNIILQAREVRENTKIMKVINLEVVGKLKWIIFIIDVKWIMQKVKKTNKD